MYYSVWKNFNSFFIKLDEKPKSWEDRLLLYVGYLVNEKKKSTTIKSYISAVKEVLADDGIFMCENRYLLNSLTQACRIVNDAVRMRLPLQKGLFELLLEDIEQIWDSQLYLIALYQGIFTAAYYGLLRIGEVAIGNHPIRAIDVHIGTNKEKILFVLRTSKTHGKGKKPQFIKISGSKLERSNAAKDSQWCPFAILQRYVMVRPTCRDVDEPFFVFTDRTGIKPLQITHTLRKSLERLNLNPMLYSFHRFCAGRANDLHQVMKLSVETVEKLGRWSSNAIYDYLR